MKDKCVVTINNKKHNIVEGTSLKELLTISGGQKNVVIALVDGEIAELNNKIKEDCNVKFVSFNERIGHVVYKNGLKFIFLEAIRQLFGDSSKVRLAHSIDKGIYVSSNLPIQITSKVINQIKSKMREIVSLDLPIEKISAVRKSAIDYFEKNNCDEKASIYKQSNNDFVTLYELNGEYNYFYGFMPISTGYIKYFDLISTNPSSMVLLFPSNGSEKIEKFIPRDKVLGVFSEYNKQINNMGVQYVCDINKKIAEGKINEFIKMNEIIHNERINSIASKICRNKNKLKFVMVGGPSSSGKTTTARKLALYLKAKGLNPYVISTDDYFVDRVDNPKDENGEYDFECLEAIDLKLFNKHLQKILKGETLKIPEYNFIMGEKEYKKSAVDMSKHDIIIIEGLHTMNEKLTSSIPRNKKYKIYASPFTPLSIDRHNHVSTLDMRLLRRIIRDNSYRGYTADMTLSKWASVRKGEDKYVFPYQNDADSIYNTAIIYEIGVLKVYIEPVLSLIEPSSPNYEEAKRLINFLSLFFPIVDSEVPNTSLLKEFVGVSYFK